VGEESPGATQNNTVKTTHNQEEIKEKMIYPRN
jgi:hypothetical protein